MHVFLQLFFSLQFSFHSPIAFYKPSCHLFRYIGNERFVVERADNAKIKVGRPFYFLNTFQIHA